METPKFASVEECQQARTRFAACQSHEDWNAYAREQVRLGHRQIKCAMCVRWCYPDKRCNWFQPMAAPETHTNNADPMAVVPMERRRDDG